MNKTTFEILASKVDLFIRQIPDYAGSKAVTSDCPLYLTFHVYDLKSCDRKRLKAFVKGLV